MRMLTTKRLEKQVGVGAAGVMQLLIYLTHLLKYM